MRFVTIILLIATFVARYRADYESCAGNVTGSSYVYGQQCYQVFGGWSQMVEQMMAKEACQGQKGNLAVVIGDLLRQKLAGIIQMMGGSEALVALIEMGSDMGLYPMGGMSWFWAVDGELQLATSEYSNQVGWHVGEPDNDPISYGQRYGALMANNGTFKAAADPFNFYICQFRKKVATLRRYAKDQSMSVMGQETEQLYGVSLSACAIACYADPSCMAINYEEYVGICNKQLVRPQDTDPATMYIMQSPGTGVWVKE